MLSTIKFVTDDKFPVQCFDSYDDFITSIPKENRRTILFCSLYALESAGNSIYDLKQLEVMDNITSLAIINDQNENLTHTVTSLLKKIKIPDSYCFSNSVLGNKVNKVIEQSYKASLQHQVNLVNAQVAVELNKKALKSAINEQAFYPVYQPQYSLKKGKYDGMEILGRLKFNDQQVSPAIFIPLLRQHNLINEYTIYIFTKSLQLLKEHGIEGNGISINIEYQSFQKKGFARQLIEICKLNQFPVHLLTVELTENRPEHSFNLYANIYDIKAFGGKISIDDFGSDAQSLEDATRISSNEIKLDMSFIRNLQTNPNNKAVIRSVIELSAKIGVRCVIEGVETKAHERFLRGIGADHVQGYLYSKPKGISELQKLLKKPNLPNEEFYLPKAILGKGLTRYDYTPENYST